MSKAQSKDAKKNGRRRRLTVLLVTGLLLSGAGLYAYRLLLQDTQPVISSTVGATRTFQGTAEERQKIDEAVFSFNLPADWKRIPPEQTVYKSYRYQSGKKNAENRYLTVFVDTIPLDRPVNKAVALRPSGSGLRHGQASENCSEFPGVQSAGQGRLQLKTTWDGVEFICDLDTETRNVIGTSSPGSVNSVRLSGPAAGSHSFFFLYEDNNYTPDYSLFYGILDSFKIK